MQNLLPSQSIVRCSVCVPALVALNANAAQVQVAGAANFTGPANEIAALFKQKTENELLPSFDGLAVFYVWITHGAPDYDVIPPE